MHVHQSNRMVPTKLKIIMFGSEKALGRKTSNISGKIPLLTGEMGLSVIVEVTI